VPYALKPAPFNVVMCCAAEETTTQGEAPKGGCTAASPVEGIGTGTVAPLGTAATKVGGMTMPAIAGRGDARPPQLPPPPE